LHAIGVVEGKGALGREKTRVAIYARISTRDKGQDTDNQLNQLRQFCAVQGWIILQEYEDHESGSRSNRIQFQKMLRDAATRRFDLLLFWALDRFTREGTLSTLKYFELLESYGVHWRSFTEPWIDSAGPFRDVIISLLASLAKQERIRISERVRAGLSRAKLEGTKSGKPIGRPPVVFRRDQARALREQGCSWGQIARQIGVSKTSVRRACQSSSE
jgi:DNA invertase Pin-like site-specific DNA recombinase